MEDSIVAIICKREVADALSSFFDRKLGKEHAYYPTEVKTSEGDTLFKWDWIRWDDKIPACCSIRGILAGFDNAAGDASAYRMIRAVDNSMVIDSCNDAGDTCYDWFSLEMDFTPISVNEKVMQVAAQCKELVTMYDSGYIDTASKSCHMLTEHINLIKSLAGIQTAEV